MSGDEIISMACKGNSDAERFCRAWVTRCHELDDCHDRDKPSDADRMVSAFLAFDIELAANPFFQANRAQLFGLMVQSANAWLDSETKRQHAAKMGGDPLPTYCEASVLKGFYHEVVFHCAFIMGGWTHLRRVTQECREYDMERTGT